MASHPACRQQSNANQNLMDRGSTKKLADDRLPEIEEQRYDNTYQMK
ncbi:hypothetical protein RvY_04233 [Ramazzottius varieornatus]|uniref:Uncharacterized protein n=1 Tax=Ramazzottius varieornatus TaxID=947166 RepID=A0A1D1V0Z4_RAMVA|nr:hypothetical protein RvY_04233 [Ramazzottius varieornatus]